MGPAERPVNVYFRAVRNTLFGKISFGVLGVALGVLVTLAIPGFDQATWEPSLRRFLTSPGAAGVAAVLAASIAFGGLHLQLTHTKAKDKEAAWWESFKWASDRAVPTDKSDVAFPRELSVEIMTSLKGTASNEVQQKACGGFMNHLLESKDAGGTTREEEALAAYVEAAVGTPASSWAAEEHLAQHYYDKAISKALDRLTADGVASTVDRKSLMRAGTPAWKFDHVLNVGEQTVVVESFAGDESTRASVLKRVYAFIGSYKERDHPLLIILPIKMAIDQAAIAGMNVEIVEWSRGGDIGVLKEALQRLAETPVTQSAGATS